MAHEIPDTGQGYEVQDAPVGTIVRFAFGISVATIVVCIALAWLLRGLIAIHDPGQRNPLAPAQQIPPEPRVEVQPWHQLERMRTREDEILRSYGWVDKEKGVVRIPIERAMDLVAERGLPVRKGVEKK